MNKTIKVTDKRMFTPEGALREEYSFLSEATSAPAEAPPPTVEAAPAAAPAAVSPASESPTVEGPPLELPSSGFGGPSFFDLLSALTEPVPFYLGDAPMPDGTSGENLEAARFYIELLDILRQKTVGNLTAQESTVLADLIYRLRVRYVQKRG